MPPRRQTEPETMHHFRIRQEGEVLWAIPIKDSDDLPTNHATLKPVLNQRQASALNTNLDNMTAVTEVLHVATCPCGNGG